MSTAGLFGDDSSDEEEEAKFDENTSNPTTTPAAKTAPSFKEEGNALNDSDEEVGTKAVDKKKPSTADLFGEDSDDDDDEEGDDGKDSKPKGDTTKETGNAATSSPAKKKPTTSELFGDDSDDDEDEGQAELDDIVGSAAPVRKKEEIYHDDAAAGDVVNGGTVAPKPPQNATILESYRPNNKDISMYMTKLPNLVAVQPAAFEEDLYIPEEEEAQYKGYVHNMIRWRYQRDKDGEIIRKDDGGLARESNTRLVQWSDGSYTLHIGNEAFDIQTVDSSSNGFAGLNGYVYLSQKATFNDADDMEEDTPSGTVLEGIGPVTSRLIAKPSSLQSEAHKSLTVAVRQRTIKTARIAEYVTQEDPEKAKAARIRNKEDLEKATARKSSYYRPTGSRPRQPGMNRRYLEEEEDDEDYDTTNIRKLKKGSAMDDDIDDYGDESDDDGYETFKKGRDRKRRQREEEEDDAAEEELVFDEESDEDEGTLIKAHKKTKRSHQAVVDDDDDED